MTNPLSAPSLDQLKRAVALREQIAALESELAGILDGKTFEQYGFHGEKPLADLVKSSVYGSLPQAVASLTVFTHPETVAQTGNQGLFRVRRRKEKERKGQVLTDTRLVACDNETASTCFLWANGMKRSEFQEAQFNHVYGRCDDPNYFTNLANICVTPAFLSKLTDKNTPIKALLRYRVLALYGFQPKGEPTKPDNYDQLRWAPPLPRVANLRAVLERALKRSPKSRAAISKEHFGWLFERHL